MLANSGDITDIIDDRLISLSLTDETGITSDMLEITLDDSRENPIKRPPTGAELELFLGYDNDLIRMGMFVCDEVQYSGWPQKMVIRARGAVFDKTPAGKSNLQSQKTRSWPAATKFGVMIEKIAKEHGMEAAVSDELKGILLPHISQSDESDLTMLIRLGKNYDAVVKPADGMLVVAKRGTTKSVSGKQLTAIELTPDDDIGSFHVVESIKEDSGTVVAYYHKTKQAKRHEVKVGSGEPVKRLKMYFPQKEMALAAAKAELSKRERRKSTLQLTAPGRADIGAESSLTLSQFRDGVDGDWIITRVHHSLEKSGGYSMDIDAETPDEGQKPVEDDEE